jgi:hypothetical protein
MNIKTRYNYLPTEALINYFEYLIGKVFKILPIFEKEPETLRSYLESLLIELNGNKELIVKLKNDGSFISLLSTLEYFLHNECSHRVYKREIFKCIKIIEKLQEKYM